MGRVTISSNNLFPGPKGDKGDQGDPGGPPGPAGPAGTTGPQGPQGPQGIQGTQGNPGAQGAEGPIGSTGLKGDKGDKGDTGATGSTGATGAKGDTGDQGPSGVVTVNAPLTNAGTSSAANLSISAGTTAAAGALQLTDSVASTSTTTAATPNAVKTAYDLGSLKPMLPSPTGSYVRTPGSAGNNNLSAGTNTAYYSPIYVKNTTSFDRIGIRTSSSFVGSASVRVGIYANGTDGKPSSLILDAGTVTASATNTLYLITINQSLNEGVYYLAMAQQTTPSTAGYLGSNATFNTLFGGATLTTSLGDFINGYYQNSVSGAFATASVTAAQAIMPYTYLRTA